MPKLFQKTVENFTCEHCGAEVVGNGFTNHCPKCLWSKHVDINPGDRASECQGMMQPIKVEVERGEHMLIYRCTKCGFLRRKKAEKDDNFDEILKIAQGVI